MTVTIPKWQLLRYAQIYQSWGTNRFRFDPAVRLLKLTPNATRVLLSQLHKKGWLTIDPLFIDSRCKYYSLKNPSVVFSEIKEEGAR